MSTSIPLWSVCACVRRLISRQSLTRCAFHTHAPPLARRLFPLPTTTTHSESRPSKASNFESNVITWTRPTTFRNRNSMSLRNTPLSPRLPHCTRLPAKDNDDGNEFKLNYKYKCVHTCLQHLHKHRGTQLSMRASRRVGEYPFACG